MELPLIPMADEEVARDIVIALAVIAPPIQVGRGKKRADESDRDRHRAAALLVEHFKRVGIRWLRKPPSKSLPSV